MSADDPQCEYALGITETESDALKWLFEVMKLIHESGKGNSARALVVNQFLIRWADHQIAMHNKIHDLEDVLIAKGYVELEVRRDPHGGGTGKN